MPPEAADLDCRWCEDDMTSFMVVARWFGPDRMGELIEGQDRSDPHRAGGGAARRLALRRLPVAVIGPWMAPDHCLRGSRRRPRRVTSRIPEPGAGRRLRSEPGRVAEDAQVGRQPVRGPAGPGRDPRHVEADRGTRQQVCDERRFEEPNRQWVRRVDSSMRSGSRPTAPSLRRDRGTRTSSCPAQPGS